MANIDLRGLRQQLSPRLIASELLEKRWMEPILPVGVFVALFGYFAVAAPGFTAAATLSSTLREFAELALVSIGMAIPLIAGGIDLSVGSIFGLANITVLILIQAVGLPAIVAIPLTLLGAAVLGVGNGVIVAYLKANAFLATLVALIIYRSFVHQLNLGYSSAIAGVPEHDVVWTWLSAGTAIGLPAAAVVALVVAVAGHLVLSRSRPGWHVTAIGASRKAARHAGIRVELVQLGSYVVSSVLAATAGCLYAARLNNGGADVGGGMELTVLTAVIIGGISLTGGRGTVFRAVIGAAVIAVLTKGLLLNDVTGPAVNVVLSVVLVIAVAVGLKWDKNRSKALEKIYINPVAVPLGPLFDVTADPGSPYRPNDRLSGAEAIGLGIVEGPEDVILDRSGRLYCVDRRGWIHRFTGPEFTEHDIFARTGGMPLGLALARDNSIVVCVGGMGLYAVHPDGEISKVTDETNRSWTSLKDDSRLRLTDDLDIVPDGRIFFSEATVRFEAEQFPLDAIEGRPNGRLVCHDPRTGRTRTVVKHIVFPNGVCSGHDGQSLLVASSWGCRIHRYWHSGPREGEWEIVADQLPGYPDNINRASDGNYWIALFGLRSPSYDLAMGMPLFRRGMVKRVPPDEWLFPSMNHGCVIKMSPTGEVIESLWDSGRDSHATVTSMREHEGYLYLGGVYNNRVGRITLPAGTHRCRCGQHGCLGAADSEPSEPELVGEESR